MGRFTKRLIGGLTAALMVAGGAFAQTSLLDDFEGGSNQNLFGDYWYFFDDNKEKSSLSGIASKPIGVGSSVVYSADVKGSGDTKELLFTADKSITAGRGGGNGAKLQFKWGNSFLTGYNNTSPAAGREPAFTGDTIYYATVGGVDGGVGGVTGDQVAKCNEVGAWKCGAFYFAPFVGIGTNLVADGSKSAPAGFENATEMRFWAKADSAVSAWVFFEQSDIGYYDGGAKRKEGAYFGMWVTVTTDWEEYIIPLVQSECSGKQGTGGGAGCKEDGELRQPEWTTPLEQDLGATFDKSKIVKVAWQIQASSTAAGQMGCKNNAVSTSNAPTVTGYANTMYLDDISFTGFRFVAGDMCEGCLVTSRPDDAFPFDQFASGSNVNTISPFGYWYVYDDTRTEVEAGTAKGESLMGRPTTGAPPHEKDCESIYVDIEAGECEVLIQSGGYLSGTFLLGNTLKIDGETVQPFVGIGTNLYNDKADEKVFYDATTAGVHGLYFEYRTDGEVNKLTFEVQDNYDATGVRPAASVYYIDLPATGGEWNKARVPFRTLVQHTNWATVTAWNEANPDKVALNQSALAKFQFKIQDGAGKNGVLQLREVYTLGAGGSAVRLAGSQAKSIGLRATYNRGVVGVNWNAAQSIASGKVSLVNVKGRTVATAPLVKSGSKVTANLGKGTIPTGMYFVRINAKDVQGKQIVQQVQLSIVK